MRIEIVTDDVPTGRLWGSGDHGLHMSEKICLGARGSTERSHDLSADDISTHDKGPCAMTDIFEFASLHFPDSEQQAFIDAHPDVYERSHGAVRLKIRAGRIALASLACAGFASAASE